MGVETGGMSTGRGPAHPLRILMSAPARLQTGAGLAEALQGHSAHWVAPGEDADLAFVSRDVTGLSTKHEVQPDTQAFYDGLLNAPSLRWVHAHSAGADRPIYQTLRQRGIDITTSSGANAPVVIQTALAGLLALARRFPQLMAAQRERRWAPLMHSGSLPLDLVGQTAVVVGWGPIGQGLGKLLLRLGLRIAVVRSSADPVPMTVATAAFEDIATLLPGADWLVLACPLTPRTRGLIDRAALGLLPPTAHVVNIARGEIVDQAALVDALQAGRLAGAYLDVFDHEPLPTDSPLWLLDNVMLTPHCAGHSEGNEQRIAAIFLDNLARWCSGQALRYRVA